jgi:hypothetical protein
MMPPGQPRTPVRRADHTHSVILPGTQIQPTRGKRRDERQIDDIGSASYAD